MAREMQRKEQGERNKRHRREQVLCPCLALLAVCPKSFSLLSSSALLSFSLHSSHSLLQCTVHVSCFSLSLSSPFPFLSFSPPSASDFDECKCDLLTSNLLTPILVTSRLGLLSRTLLKLAEERKKQWVHRLCSLLE